jgi:carboxypeptidase family protein
MRSASHIVALAVSLFLSLSTLTLGQTSTTSRHGIVTDAKGALIAGADVTISDSANGFSRSTKTDSEGVYKFPQIPPATYLWP